MPNFDCNIGPALFAQRCRMRALNAHLLSSMTGIGALVLRLVHLVREWGAPIIAWLVVAGMALTLVCVLFAPAE
jgi:hypothetical protein